MKKRYLFLLLILVICVINLVVSMLILSRSPVSTTPETFVFKGEKMNIQENKNVARRFIQIWGKGALDIIDELAAPDFRWQYPVSPEAIRGKEKFRQVMEGFRSAFPDSDILIEDEIAEDDRVVIRWTFSGTHKGNILGIPGTNKKVKWTGITIYRIADGKVLDESGEEDLLGFFFQIGLVQRPI